MDALFIFVPKGNPPPAAMVEKVESLPDQKQLADNVWLIRSSMLVKELSAYLGMGEEPIGSGVVFRLNGTYWGRADANIWDWLGRG